MRKRAITLIEMVIVITIVAIGAGIFMALITKSIDIFVLYKDYNAAQMKAVRTMNKISTQIRKAKRIDTVYLINPDSMQFRVDEPEGAGGLMEVLQNMVGFFVIPKPQNFALFFYDWHATGKVPSPGTPYGASFLSDPANLYFDGSNTFVKFKLANIKYPVIFRFLGVSRDNPANAAEILPGNLSDFHNTNLPGQNSTRLVRIVMNVEEGDESFTLGSMVRIRRNNLY